MNNNRRRITRGSEKKKEEEDDLKKKTKIHNVVRTRLEEKKMRSLEETRLRSEDVGLSSICNDDDDGSDTSMEMLKDEVVLRFKQLFRTNVLYHLGSNNLTGIVCKSVESMIKFCRKHIIVYFISKEDKQYQRDVIACIIDDVIPDLKNELTLFMKETKLDTKKQEEVDKINKKWSTTKSKPKIIPPPIIDSSSKPIFISPPIIDSSIDKSTVTNLNKNNNNELVNEEPVNENNNNNNVDVDSEDSTFDESNDESCGIDKNLKFNNDDDDDDEDSDDDSINRTTSDESIDESHGNDNECNVILPDMRPLTIGTNIVNTQGVASSVNIHGKKYSDETLLKKHCMLK